MTDEDAKDLAIRAALRIEAAHQALVVNEHGRFANFRTKLEWYPIVPGSVILRIMGVDWNDSGDGGLDDPFGIEDGTINYDTGEVRFYDGVGIDGNDVYTAHYAYDIEEAERKLAPVDLQLIGFDYVRAPEPQFRIRMEDLQ